MAGKNEILNLGALVAELKSPFRVVAYGQSAVKIEGHKGVVFWDGERVIFRRKKGTITIEGSRLCIREISLGDAYVEGVIENVTFEVKPREVNV